MCSQFSFCSRGASANTVETAARRLRLLSRRETNLASVALLAYACVVFVSTYLSDSTRPHGSYSNGWYDIWYDQSQYFDMVKGISHRTLGHFQFPSGYPLFGWCTWFVKSDPFLIADLLLFGAFVFFSFEIFNTLLNPALSLASTVLLIHCSVALFEIPWTSSLSATALVCLLWIVLRDHYNFRYSVLIGVCLAVSFAARVGDVAIGLALLVAAFATTSEKVNAARHYAISVLTSLVGAAVVLALNHHLSGSAFGTYLASVRQGGFNPAALPWKIYGFVLDPFLYAGETNPLAKPLAVVVPGLLLSPVGLFALRKTRSAIFWLFVAFLAGWLCVYGGYVALSGFTLKYGSVHYAKVLFPIAVGTSFYFFQRVAESGVRWRLLAAYIGLMLAIIILPRIAVHKLSASEFTVRSNTNNAEAARAADGNDLTDWSSGVPQSSGMTFDVDVKQPRFIYRITADTHASPNGIGRDVSIYRSADAVNWEYVAAVNNDVTGVSPDYRFEPVRARYFRLRLTKASRDWWSIHEIRVYSAF
jgi:F5/8 type C domain